MTELTQRALTDESLDAFTPARRLFRNTVHWAAYRFILTSSQTRVVHVNGLELVVPPTVFHPGVFVTSRMFAKFLREQNLEGRSVAEIGTGSGILAISAAKAGANEVLAIDINPAAVLAAERNAATNGVSEIVKTKVSDLFSAVTFTKIFDVIISSPPSFEGKPRDMADRAWHAGQGYGGIALLFEQAYNHLASTGVMFILLSSDTNVKYMRKLAFQAGFDWQLVAEKSIWVEAFQIFCLKKRIDR